MRTKEDKLLVIWIILVTILFMALGINRALDQRIIKKMGDRIEALEKYFYLDTPREF